MQLFENHVAARLARVRLGDTPFDIAKAISLAIGALIQSYCAKSGVDAAKCAYFYQKGTLLDQQMNDAINAEDLVGIAIVVNSLNDFKKEVQDAIDAANQEPPKPTPTPAPSGGLSTGAMIGIGVGVAGVLGLILYAVTR